MVACPGLVDCRPFGPEPQSFFNHATGIRECQKSDDLTRLLFQCTPVAASSMPKKSGVRLANVAALLPRGGALEIGWGSLNRFVFASPRGARRLRSCSLSRPQIRYSADMSPRLRWPWASGRSPFTVRRTSSPTKHRDGQDVRRTFRVFFQLPLALNL